MKKATNEKIWYAITVTAAAVVEISVTYFARWAVHKYAVDLVRRMNNEE